MNEPSVLCKRPQAGQVSELNGEGGERQENGVILANDEREKVSRNREAGMVKLICAYHDRARLWSTARCGIPI